MGVALIDACNLEQGVIYKHKYFYNKEECYRLFKYDRNLKEQQVLFYNKQEQRLLWNKWNYFGKCRISGVHTYEPPTIDDVNVLNYCLSNNKLTIPLYLTDKITPAEFYHQSEDPILYLDEWDTSLMAENWGTPIEIKGDNTIKIKKIIVKNR